MLSEIIFNRQKWEIEWPLLNLLAGNLYLERKSALLNKNALTHTTMCIMSTTRDRITQIYHQPLPNLLFNAQKTHRSHHDPCAVQLCTLSNIKTGLCPEDCAYCAQSVHNKTGLVPQELMSAEAVVAEAQAAKANGSTRFCMGAAWREVKDNSQFERVLEMVRQVAALGMETCCTLGMLKPHQAMRLKEAGLTA